nr:PREDICTED: coiled-coil domain-containing protein 69-like isoform X2 [Anolis carolinensis]|eukprot:XP_016846976.1 PREDICTED: coiled-coil domain-containing protein 69-like isoform X2 [Anolis carolinensis]
MMMMMMMDMKVTYIYCFLFSLLFPFEQVNITPLRKGAEKCEVELLEKHNNEITKLQQQHQEKECLQKADLTETERLRQDVKIQVKKNKDLEFRQELSERYNLLERKLDERLGELEKVHDQERYFLMKSYEKSKSSLQNFESPSQFWHQEAERLHFLIHMKNARIHHMDEKLFNFETVQRGVNREALWEM